MKTVAVTNAPLNLGDVTPFAKGFNCVAANFTAGALTLQGSADGTTFTTLATLPAGSLTNVTGLPQYVQLSAAGTVYLLN